MIRMRKAGHAGYMVMVGVSRAGCRSPPRVRDHDFGSLQPAPTVHVVTAFHVPAIVSAAGEKVGTRFLEFFAANICNPHTRRAYSRAVAEFLAWCDAAGVAPVAAVQPLHVAAWIEQQTREHAGIRAAVDGGSSHGESGR
jgi:hypothetical protein